MRWFFGLARNSGGYSLPMIGTPWEVPEPRKMSVNDITVTTLTNSAPCRNRVEGKNGTARGHSCPQQRSRRRITGNPRSAKTSGIAADRNVRAPEVWIVLGRGICQLSQMPAPKRRLPSPPYNPGVRDLVEGKRAWDARPNPADQPAGFRGWHERGYIPHRDSPGLTQFITWHLADAFPAALRGEWAALLEVEDDRERRKELEAYLDKGRGESWLRRPDIAAVCEDAVRHFDRERYTLKAWC